MLTGCSINQQFVDSVDRACKQILPEYEAYLAQDESIDDTSRAIRLRTSLLLRRLIVEARQLP